MELKAAGHEAAAQEKDVKVGRGSGNTQAGKQAGNNLFNFA